MVPSEEFVAHHGLLITKSSNKTKEAFTPKVLLWKLRGNEGKRVFKKYVAETIDFRPNSKAAEDIWKNLKSNLLKIDKTSVE